MVTNLKNPGFEGITRPGGYNQITPQMYIPEGWEYWSLGDEPEIHVIGRVAPFLNPMRLMDGGNWALKIFKSFGKLNCGLKQVVVGLTPGHTYEFGIWAHAWSAHQTEGLHKDGDGGWDAAWSAGVGYGTTPIPCDEIPELNGNAMNDAIGNVTFWCFAKVEGKTVDAPCVAIYNAYSPVTPVRFVAPSSGIAEVGFGIQTLWRFNTGDGYFDNAYLVEVGDEPPTEPCQGLPRVQYERVVNVVPESAGIARAVDVLMQTWPQTVSNSYDDAGIGALSDKTAVLWDIPAAERSEFTDFYREYYPGTKIEFAGDSEPEPEPVTLSLTYPTTHMPPVVTSRFGDTAGRTIPHCGLDLRSSWAVWGDEVLCALPGTVITSGDVGGGFGVQVRTKTTLADGRTVYVRYAHLVASKPRAQIGDMLAVGDVVGYPNSGGVSTGDHLHIDVMVDGKYMDPEPLIEWPADPGTPSSPVTPPPASRPVPRCMFGVHLQDGYRGDMEFIRDVQPEVVKLVGNFEKSQIIKANSPNTKVIIRYHTNNQEPYYNHPLGADAGALAWYDNFGPTLEKYAPYIDYVESVNEEVPTHNDDKLRAVVAFDVAFCKLLEDRDFPARPIVLTAAIGNPDHGAETRLMIPAAREAARCGGAVGYHAYFGYNWQQQFSDLDDPAEAKHFCMRALWSYDPEFVKAGVYVDYIFTETGPIYLAGSPGHWYTPSAEGGWRWSGCMNGSFEHFLRYAQKAMGMWATWNATHQNRCRGGTWFTLGGPGWSNFEYGQYLGRLTEAMKAP